MKTIKNLFLIFISALLMMSCSTSSKVVSGNLIKKRKYNKGFYFQKKNINKIDNSNIIEDYYLTTSNSFSNDELSASLSSALFNEKPLTDKVKLKAGKTIQFQTVNIISSKEVFIGEEVSLRVLRDVEVDDKVVIEGGTIAYGKVVYREKGKGFGKPGLLSIKADRVLAVDGEMVYLSGERVTREGDSNNTGAIVVIVLCLLFWPLLWVPFLMKGKEGVIQSGTTVTGRVNSSTKIEVE
tara:strand:- start:124 stop:840 length:717 start_codon:yes stop_codon:yes gene_type:complete